MNDGLAVRKKKRRKRIEKKKNKKTKKAGRGIRCWWIRLRLILSLWFKVLPCLIIAGVTWSLAQKLLKKLRQTGRRIKAPLLRLQRLLSKLKAWVSSRRGVGTGYPGTIPAVVKREVWARDSGKCCQCGNRHDLHFDHIIPWSKGGSSTDPKNVQILCSKHNLQKSDKIE